MASNPGYGLTIRVAPLLLRAGQQCVCKPLHVASLPKPPVAEKMSGVKKACSTSRI